MLFELTNPRADLNTLVIAKSTGGSKEEGYGMPTEVMILGVREWVHVKGLNTANPTARWGVGANLVQQSRPVQEDLKVAARMGWVATGDRIAELRTGVREAKDPLKQFEGVHLSEGSKQDATLPLAAREFGERMVQAASLATGAPNDDAQALANSFHNDGKSYAQAQGNVVGKQHELIAELEKLIASEAELADQLGDENLLPQSQEELEMKLEQIRRKIEAAKKDLVTNRKTIEESLQSPSK
jgi:hypothetical protein